MWIGGVRQLDGLAMCVYAGLGSYEPIRERAYSCLEVENVGNTGLIGNVFWKPLARGAPVTRPRRR
jgi:hypothetical protein